MGEAIRAATTARVKAASSPPGLFANQAARPSNATATDSAHNSAALDERPSAIKPALSDTLASASMSARSRSMPGYAVRPSKPIAAQAAAVTATASAAASAASRQRLVTTNHTASGHGNTLATTRAATAAAEPRRPRNRQATATPSTSSGVNAPSMSPCTTGQDPKATP